MLLLLLDSYHLGDELLALVVLRPYDDSCLLVLVSNRVSLVRNSLVLPELLTHLTPRLNSVLLVQGESLTESDSESPTHVLVQEVGTSLGTSVLLPRLIVEVDPLVVNEIATLLCGLVVLRMPPLHVSFGTAAII